MTALTHVLFDFFGTLVAYSASRVEQGVQRSHAMLVAAGASLSYEEFTTSWEATSEQLEQHAQLTLDEFSMDELCAAFLRRVLPREPGDALVTSFRDTYLDEWSKGVRYLPGVTALLAQLSQRFTLVLVTNTHHAELVHGHLRRMDASRYFHSVITSVEHGRRKPSPCIFEQALERSNGSKEAAVYVGDSFAADYQGALNAGLRPLLIDPDAHRDVPPQYRIADILEARVLLEQ